MVDGTSNNLSNTYMSKIHTPEALENMIGSSGKIDTWEKLGAAIALMSPEQRQTNLAIELELADECYSAQFRICGENHEILDDGHPVIFAIEDESQILNKG